MGMTERIREQRKGHGISQTELANRLGVSLRTISRWELGERSPKASILPQLASALHTTVGYLMGIEEPAPEGSGAEKPNNPAEGEGTSKEAVKEPQIRTEDKGVLSYTFSNGERLELPATPEGFALFKEMVAQRLDASSKGKEC